MRLVIATRSTDKLREIRQMLAPIASLDVLDLSAAGVDPEPAEDDVEVYDTFRENALAKARYYAARAGTLVLADDSGICVDALGGAPGVRSKRFSGVEASGRALDAANNALLLERLRGVPPERRGAHYACAVALYDPISGREAVVEGFCEGVVLEAPRGGAGFGYDPLFFLPEDSATFGELPAERKNLVSHRARAIGAAAELLRQWV